MFQTEIKQGSLSVIIRANDAQGPFHCRLYVNCGETITHYTKTSKTLQGAQKAAAKLFDQYNSYIS